MRILAEDDKWVLLCLEVTRFGSEVAQVERRGVHDVTSTRNRKNWGNIYTNIVFLDVYILQTDLSRKGAVHFPAWLSHISWRLSFAFSSLWKTAQEEEEVELNSSNDYEARLPRGVNAITRWESCISITSAPKWRSCELERFCSSHCSGWYQRRATLRCEGLANVAQRGKIEDYECVSRACEWNSLRSYSDLRDIFILSFWPTVGRIIWFLTSWTPLLSGIVGIEWGPRALQMVLRGGKSAWSCSWRSSLPPWHRNSRGLKFRLGYPHVVNSQLFDFRPPRSSSTVNGNLTRIW